jgi:hypothetical protein
MAELRIIENIHVWRNHMYIFKKHKQRSAYTPFCLFFLFCFYLVKATSAHAINSNEVAKCSNYMNNFNHKYGQQLLNNGYTHNTVYNDKLYAASMNMQLAFMVTVAFKENWDLSSYDNYIYKMRNSPMLKRVYRYDQKDVENMRVGDLKAQAFGAKCKIALNEYIGALKGEDSALEIFDQLAIYMEKMRGF